jgi:flagellar motor component MotA
MNLLEKAKKAINAVFSDTSVSQTETIDRLEELSEEIRICMTAIEEDQNVQSWRDE